MKNILLIIVVFFTLLVNGQEFKFESETMDFRNIIQGSREAKVVFKFENIGDAPIIIDRIKYSSIFYCKAPKKPIMPGETGEVSVKCHTGHLGKATTFIDIYSNAKGNEIKELRVKANICKYISIKEDVKS